ncbi:MAG: type VII toxin-antitoxin system HepT family RNase toxin [Candidatus Helarchaeota archaeon]
MRINLIKNKLKIIEENIELVKKNLPEKVNDFLELGLIKDGIYKRIEASIQEILSICSIINADLKLGIPANRDEIISTLVKNKILSNKMGNIIKELKGFRNFLVHRYGKIDDEVAFHNIKDGLNDFELFLEEIPKIIKKYPKD